MSQINLIAVLISAIIAFVIGFLAHGPIAGKLWMRLANIQPTGNEKFSDMIPQMLWNLLTNFITAFVLAGILWMASTSRLIGTLTWYQGAICAIWLWFGFLFTSSAIEVIWMKRSVKLWLFESICSLIVMVAMGIILVIW